MNDLVILGIVLGTVVLALFLIQERETNKRALELRMYQMELMRQHQQNQAENRQFFRGLFHNVGQIYLKLDEEGGEKK